VGVDIINELNVILGTSGTAGTLPAKYGSYSLGNGSNSFMYPDWYTAKAQLDAATAGSDQTAYQNAFAIFQNVDYLLSYRVDLLSDLRRFRQAFSY
jgi:hypothetical protein